MASGNLPPGPVHAAGTIITKSPVSDARLDLEAEADRFGVPLDVADVLLPRTAGCGDKWDHAE